VNFRMIIERMVRIVRMISSGWLMELIVPKKKE